MRWEAIGIAFLLGGCTQVIDPWDLRRIGRQAESRGQSDWFYSGTEGAHHFLEHFDGKAWRRYRVPEDELWIGEPFPKAESRRSWREIDPESF